MRPFSYYPVQKKAKQKTLILILLQTSYTTYKYIRSQHVKVYTYQHTSIFNYLSSQGQANAISSFLLYFLLCFKFYFRVCWFSLGFFYLLYLLFYSLTFLVFHYTLVITKTIHLGQKMKFNREREYFLQLFD